MSNFIWTTKEGKKIKLKDMSDNHILNTERLIRRKATVMHSEAILDGYAAVSCLQGEMAIYYAEQELDMLETMDTQDYLIESCPVYKAILKEIEKRKLKLKID